MKRSHQPIEPDVLEVLYAHKKDSLETIMSILSWLSYKINIELKKRCINVEIEVIKVEYVSVYPALAAYYKEQEFRKINDNEDIEDLVIELCEACVKEGAFSEYFDYIINYKDKIKREIDNYNSTPNYNGDLG